jgi:hypothetical protein
MGLIMPRHPRRHAPAPKPILTLRQRRALVRYAIETERRFDAEEAERQFDDAEAEAFDEAAEIERAKSKLRLELYKALTDGAPPPPLRRRH